MNRASAAADFTNRAAGANRGPISSPISRPEAGSTRAEGGSAYTGGTRSVYTGGGGSVYTGGTRRAAAAAAAAAAAGGAGGGIESVSLPVDSMIGTMGISVAFMLIATILAIVERVTKKTIQELCGCAFPAEGGDVINGSNSKAEDKEQKEEDEYSSVVVAAGSGGGGGDKAILSDIHRMMTELRAEAKTAPTQMAPMEPTMPGMVASPREAWRE